MNLFICALHERKKGGEGFGVFGGNPITKLIRYSNLKKAPR
jgi:hypothetical protein